MNICVFTTKIKRYMFTYFLGVLTLYVDIFFDDEIRVKVITIFFIYKFVLETNFCIYYMKGTGDNPS